MSGQTLSISHLLVVVARADGDLLSMALDAATGLQAELCVLVPRDEALFRAAALPFTQQIGATLGQSYPLEVGALERELAGRSNRLQQELARQAPLRGVRWRLATLAWSLREELPWVQLVKRLECALRDASAIFPPSGSKAAAEAERPTQQGGHRLLVLAPDRMGRQGSLVMVWPASQAERAAELLATGTRLAAALGAPMQVVVPAQGEAGVAPAVAAALRGTRVERVIPVAATALGQALAGLAARAVLWPAVAAPGAAELCHLAQRSGALQLVLLDSAPPAEASAEQRERPVAD